MRYWTVTILGSDNVGFILTHLEEVRASSYISGKTISGLRIHIRPSSTDRVTIEEHEGDPK